MATLFTGQNVEDVDDHTAQTIGSFLLALQAGLAAQWLLARRLAPRQRRAANG